MRARPVTIVGLPTSAPPDGLIATSSPRPSASRSTSSSAEHTAVSSATSTPPLPTPARAPATWVDADVGEIAHPRVVRVGAVVDAGDPGRALDEVARAVAGHEHDRGGAVDRWADVVLAQRRNHVVLGEQVLGREVARHRGGGAALGVAS